MKQLCSWLTWDHVASKYPKPNKLCMTSERRTSHKFKPSMQIPHNHKSKGNRNFWNKWIFYIFGWITIQTWPTFSKRLVALLLLVYIYIYRIYSIHFASVFGRAGICDRVGQYLSPIYAWTCIYVWYISWISKSIWLWVSTTSYSYIFKFKYSFRNAI